MITTLAQKNFQTFTGRKRTETFNPPPKSVIYLNGAILAATSIGGFPDPKQQADETIEYSIFQDDDSIEIARQIFNNFLVENNIELDDLKTMDVINPIEATTKQEEKSTTEIAKEEVTTKEATTKPEEETTKETTTKEATTKTQTTKAKKAKKAETTKANKTSKTKKGTGIYQDITSLDVDKDSFVQKFDTACARKENSILEGKGSEIYEIAVDNGINPAFYAAIMCLETGYGTSYAITYKNNPGGIMKRVNGKKILKSYESLDEGLNTTARLLKNNYIDKGLTTIDTIGDKYDPGSSEWKKIVLELYTKFST